MHIFESNGEYNVEIGNLELSIINSSNGYKVYISNIRNHISKVNYDRLDVKEKLHHLDLNRLNYNGYLNESRVIKE